MKSRTSPHRPSPLSRPYSAGGVDVLMLPGFYAEPGRAGRILREAATDGDDPGTLWACLVTFALWDDPGIAWETEGDPETALSLPPEDMIALARACFMEVFDPSRAVRMARLGLDPTALLLSGIKASQAGAPASEVPATGVPATGEG